MKRLIFLMTLFLSTAFFLPTYTCEAKDVWVERWNYENVDIYVMDDTITSGSSGNSKYFNVTVKEVRNRMKGTHTTVVIPKNQIFEFCMDALGWPYTIKEFWYY